MLQTSIKSQPAFALSQFPTDRNDKTDLNNALLVPKIVLVGKSKYAKCDVKKCYRLEKVLDTTAAWIPALSTVETAPTLHTEPTAA